MPASILIPTKNRPDLLKQCVESVRHRILAKDYEIIVVDTGDGEDGAWAARNGCLVINAQGATFAQANNAAAKSARGDVLWLLNNDVILTNDCLTRWADAALQAIDKGIIVPPSHSILGARLLYPNGLIQHAGVGFDNDGNPYHLWHNGPGEHPEAMKTRYLPAVTFACALIGKRLWRELGGLDERYVNAYEDIDFCLRARELGYPVRYVPEAVATHLTAQTPGRFDHTSDSEQSFQDAWLKTGRIYYVLGSWPFSIEKG